MLLWNRLWRDEAGVVLSAEAVLLGTVGVLGAVVGMSTISHAVDGELKEVAYAIRSLDQSYGYYGHQSRGAWTAGSYYIQPAVEKSIADLGVQSEADAAAIQQQVDAMRKKNQPSDGQTPRVEENPSPAAPPNDLPMPEANPKKKTKKKVKTTPL